MRHRRRRRRDGGGGGGVGKTALAAQCRWCRSPRPMQSPTARTVNETPRRQRSSRAVCWFAWSTRRAHAVRSAHTLMAFSRCRSAKRASKRERCKRARELPRPSHENTQCATRSSMYESDAARGREGDEASRRGAAGAAAAGGGARRARERLSARLRDRVVVVPSSGTTRAKRKLRRRRLLSSPRIASAQLWAARGHRFCRRLLGGTSIV